MSDREVINTFAQLFSAQTYNIRPKKPKAEQGRTTWRRREEFFDKTHFVYKKRILFKKCCYYRHKNSSELILFLL